MLPSNAPHVSRLPSGVKRKADRDIANCLADPESVAVATFQTLTSPARLSYVANHLASRLSARVETSYGVVIFTDSIVSPVLADLIVTILLASHASQRPSPYTGCPLPSIQRSRFPDRDSQTSTL